MEPKPYVITRDRASLADQDRGLLYVDTTGDDDLRAGRDLDLSHWYPNRTPRRYRANTSAAIALRFAAEHPDHEYVVVNDHADTDGVVSVFALVYPSFAVAHGDVLAQVAAMGDFSFYGDAPARLCYAALSDRRTEVRTAEGADNQAVFAECLAFLRRYLEGHEPLRPAWQERADALARSAGLVDEGGVERTQLGERLVEYRITRDLAPVHLDLMRRQPRFDQALDSSVWSSHRARNRLDAERVHLLAVPDGDRWRYGLWYPQYLPWDTETLWRAPGFAYTGDRLTWQYECQPLADAARRLESKDHGVTWLIRDTIAPWSDGFPIVLEPMAGGRPVGSRLAPDTVAGALATALGSLV